MDDAAFEARLRGLKARLEVRVQEARARIVAARTEVELETRGSGHGCREGRWGIEQWPARAAIGSDVRGGD